ncbi:MAG: histidinol dehydrogenase [Oscillospiraceae bacterium]|nr:histidinol dehydrogenase [Oscillospiraceae bacterium]
MMEILTCGQVPNDQIFARKAPAADVSRAVSAILADVRREGDAALLRYAAEFDGAAPERLEVTPAEIDASVSQVEPEFLAVLERAAANIRDYHRRQLRTSYVVAEQDGMVLGQKVTPLARVGLYIPGGTASYPSSVLMNAIPAKLAGVPEVVMTTPAANGRLNPAILAAAKVAGVDRIFRTGGAQAVAALAYGTESVPRVDKIVGPGNAYVAEAKRQVFGQVAIDMIAGPSEILVVADGTCDPRFVAADLLSQAEHDRLASAVLVTDSAPLARAVAAELERQLSSLPRAEIARASLEQNGRIIVAENLDQAIEIANELAPEHLELSVENPFDCLSRVRNAGSIFLGKFCPESLGDYLAGPNHTLPTMGTARFSSPLTVDDFVKKSAFSYCTAPALAAMAADIALFARQEGLEAHARAALIRFEEASR